MDFAVVSALVVGHQVGEFFYCAARSVADFLGDKNG
jgi:hypothetical protein